MIRSGCSRSSSVEPQGWISSTPACTRPISPASRRSRSADRPPRPRGRRSSGSLVAAPARRASGRSTAPAIPVRAAHQRERPVRQMRPIRGQLGIVVGEALLGDARLRPVDPIGMGELHRRLRCRHRLVAHRRPAPACRLAHDPSALVLAQAAEGGVAQRVAGPARNSTSATSSAPPSAPPRRVGRQLLARTAHLVRRQRLQPLRTDRAPTTG